MAMNAESVTCRKLEISSGLSCESGNCGRSKYGHVMSEYERSDCGHVMSECGRSECGHVMSECGRSDCGHVMSECGCSFQKIIQPIRSLKVSQSA